MANNDLPLFITGFRRRKGNKGGWKKRGIKHQDIKSQRHAAYWDSLEQYGIAERPAKKQEEAQQ